MRVSVLLNQGGDGWLRLDSEDVEEAFDLGVLYNTYKDQLRIDLTGNAGILIPLTIPAGKESD
jgi:hypothetical protein